MRPSRIRRLQRQTGHLAANRIKRGDDNGLGRVVDDQIDARRGFERANVAAFAADDAALHILVGQVDHGNGGLGHMVGSAFLNGQRDNVAGFLFALFLGVLLDIAHKHGGVVIRVLLDAGDEHLARFVLRHRADALHFGLLLGDENPRPPCAGR